MLSESLFKIGPYDVCIWNLIFFAAIFLGAAILRRIVHRFLKRQLTQANVKVEGKLNTYIKLTSQSIYFIALYIAVWSFNINNDKVSFRQFLDHKIIDLEKFNLSFYHIIVLTVVFFAAKITVNLVKLYINLKFRNSKDFNAGTEYVYVQIAKYIIYLFAILLSLQVLEIELTIFLTGSAALLVGIGFGLQDLFKDMISGIVLLVEGNVKVGDVIEIKDAMANSSSGMVAKIIQINVRTTKIQTREGNVLIIPNTRLTQDSIENWSHGSELTRFLIPVTVAYGTNVELVMRLLKQAALSHPKVKKNQPVMVRMNDFGDNGLKLELVFWADQSWDINNYKSEIRIEIDRLFREYKIEIPYPQRDLHILERKNPFDNKMQFPGE